MINFRRFLGLGRARRAIDVAAVVMLAACGGSPTASGDGSIQGTVTDNTGATVANAAVELTGNAQAARTTTSGGDGVYTFANLPAGTYTLAVTPPAGFTTGAASTTSVTVAGGAKTNASAFVLNRLSGTNGSVRGVVTDNTGGAVVNAVVELTGNDQPARATTSDCDGAYTFADLPPGPYTVAVTPPAGFTAGAAGTTKSIAVAIGSQANAAALVLNRTAVESAFVVALRARLAAATAAGEFSGAVLVTRDAQTVFEGACGFADRERRIPNTPLTRFRVGSMNKMLTAVAMLQLVQAGKVQLNAPFGTYLTDYPNADMASKVTLHHLLTHTGGTGDIFGAQFNAHRLELRDTKDYLALYGTRALQFQPGTQWDYSNYGFMLLGAVIERVSGMTYDDYVATHVLAPAGMTATGAAPEDSDVPGRSVGYMKQSNLLVSNASVLPYRGTPAGGWYSTVGDFERFVAALREHRLLDPTHTALLLDGKVQMGQSVVKYAYGFIDRVQEGRRLVGHGGAYPGMSGELSFEPAGGYMVVILSNFDPPAATLIEAFILGILPSG